MKKVILLVTVVLFTFNSLGAGLSAQSKSDKPVEKKKEEEKISQLYKGDIVGLKSMMSDLSESNPTAHGQLLGDFKSLKSAQFNADVVWYGGYAISTGAMLYGMYALFSGFSLDSEEAKIDFTPYIVSVALFYITGWTYEAMRPSKQDYLDFTNKHNRVNPGKQLEWEKTSWRAIPKPIRLVSLNWTF